MAPGKRRDTASKVSPLGLGGVTLDRAFAELRPEMFALAYDWDIVLRGPAATQGRLARRDLPLP